MIDREGPGLLAELRAYRPGRRPRGWSGRSCPPRPRSRRRRSRARRRPVAGDRAGQVDLVGVQTGAGDRPGDRHAGKAASSASTAATDRHLVEGARAAADVGAGAVVARRGDDQHAGVGGGLDRRRLSRSCGGAERQPSDMLITSTPSETARSMAAITMRPRGARHSRTPGRPSAWPAGRRRARRRRSLFSVFRLYGPGVGRAVSGDAAPAAVPATWEPWPWQSSGSGSGCGMVLAGSSSRGRKSSPTKSYPPVTLAVGKVPGSITVPSLSANAAAVPGPPKSAWV